MSVPGGMVGNSPFSPNPSNQRHKAPSEAPTQIDRTEKSIKFPYIFESKNRKIRLEVYAGLQSPERTDIDLRVFFLYVTDYDLHRYNKNYIGTKL